MVCRILRRRRSGLNLLAGFSLLICAFGVLLAPAASAQPAGNRIGGCAEAAYLDAGQRSLAAALSLTQGDIPGGVEFRDEAGFRYGVVECAKSIRRNVCTDKLLFAMLNPFGLSGGAAVGGATIGGRDGRPSLLGGALAHGIAAPIEGMIKLVACQKRQQELSPAVTRALSGWRVNLSTVRREDIYRRLAAIGGWQGREVLGYVQDVERHIDP